MAVKFYNPGSKIVEMIRFDHPTNDPKVQNTISYYPLSADEKSYFEVPTEVEVTSDNGPVSVVVRFAERLQKDYREYGLVRINPKAKNIADDDNVALDEKAAKEKGDRLWREYLETKAREHIFNVEQAGAMGAVPQRARGVYKHALDVLGIADPADKVGTAINKTQDTVEMSEMKKRLAEMEKLVQSMAKGK